MPTRQLNESGSVASDGFGNGVVRIGPKSYRELWRVTNVAVRSTNTNDVTLVARVYLGGAVPGNLLGGTYDGGNDSTDVKVDLHPGQELTCVWTTEPAGIVSVPVTHTMSVYGTMDF